MISAIIFDADDTLWETEVLYQRALDLSQAEVERHGVDGAAWRARQLEVDLDAVKTRAFDRDRFPSSSARAYRDLAAEPNPQIERRVYDLTATVFDSPAELYPHVQHVLGVLCGTYKLAVATKGDREVQHARLERSGLTRLFDTIAIVETKTPTMFRSICDQMGEPPGAVVSVGNSLRSDILPAVEAGLHAVWIDAQVWEHERLPDASLPDSVIELSSFAHLPEAIARMSEPRR